MKNLKIIRIGYAIQEYLINNSLIDAKPKDLMPMLIQKGFFKQDHRNGLPLRKILRKLDDENLLYLIPQVSVVRKDKNRLWFFNAIEV